LKSLLSYLLVYADTFNAKAGLSMRK